MELLKFFIVSRTEYNTSGVKVCGLKQGVHYNFTEREIIMYKDAEHHGLCRYWYANGQIQHEHNYVDEQHESCRYWYENGHLWYDRYYVHGVAKN